MPEFLGSESEVDYIVSGVSPEVDHALRALASKDGKTLNQVIVEIMVNATTGRQQRADFSDLVGRWGPDPAFDEIIESQRKIEHSTWNQP